MVPRDVKEKAPRDAGQETQGARYARPTCLDKAWFRCGSTEQSAMPHSASFQKVLTARSYNVTGSCSPRFTSSMIFFATISAAGPGRSDRGPPPDRKTAGRRTWPSSCLSSPEPRDTGGASGLLLLDVSVPSRGTFLCRGSARTDRDSPGSICDESIIRSRCPTRRRMMS
jgi:hypothetical protein